MSFSPEVVAAFLLGGATGLGLSWMLAVHKERFRRIRRDLKASKNGIKTLRKMLRREAGALVRGAGVVVLVLSALLFLVTR